MGNRYAIRRQTVFYIISLLLLLGLSRNRKSRLPLTYGPFLTVILSHCTMCRTVFPNTFRQVVGIYKKLTRGVKKKEPSFIFATHKGS